MKKTLKNAILLLFIIVSVSGYAQRIMGDSLIIQGTLRVTDSIVSNGLIISKATDVDIESTIGSAVTFGYAEEHYKKGGAFEAIDEGSGIGYRATGSDASKKAIIGSNSLDLSGWYAGAETNYGATGSNSLLLGNDMKSSGGNSLGIGYLSVLGNYGVISFGDYNNITGLYGFNNGQYNNNSAWAGATFGYGNNVGATSMGFASGDQNIIGSSGYSAHAFGQMNNINSWAGFGAGSSNTMTNGATAGAVLGQYNSVSSFASFATGVYNTETSTSSGYNSVGGNGNVSGGNANFMNGVALLQTNGVGATILGVANIDVAASAVGNNSTNPMIIIGNGRVNTPTGAAWNAISRSNLLVGLRNGEVTLPSTTIEIIDSEATGKQVVTREWVQANSSGITGDQGLYTQGLLSTSDNIIAIGDYDGVGNSTYVSIEDNDGNIEAYTDIGNIEMVSETGNIGIYSYSSEGVILGAKEGRFRFQNYSGTYKDATIAVPSTLVDHRTYTLPDKDGTFAMLSDVNGGYVTINTTDTITGQKTFRTDIIVAVDGGDYATLKNDLLEFVDIEGTGKWSQYKQKGYWYEIPVFDGAGSENSSNTISVNAPTFLPTDASIILPSVSGTLIVEVAPPSTATSVGIKGQRAYNNDYSYVCIATNTWKRSPLTTW